MFGDPWVGSFVDPTDSVVLVVWLCACECMLRWYAHDVEYEDDTIIRRGSMYLLQ